MREDGVWKLSRLHAYNTFTAACEGGWAHSPNRSLPRISEDTALYEECSSLPGLLQTDTPLFVTDAELDPPMFRNDAERLERLRAKAGRPVHRLRLEIHSHISETYAVGTSDRSLSAPVREFIGQVLAVD